MSSSNDVAVAWLGIIKVLVIVLLIWGVLNDLVTNVLYKIGVAAGGNVQLLDMIVMFWQWLPLLVLFSSVVWGVVVSARISSDTIEYR